MLMADWMRRSYLSTLVTYFTALVRMMRKTRNVLMTAAELRFEPWRATHACSFTPSFSAPASEIVLFSEADVCSLAADSASRLRLL